MAVVRTPTAHRRKPLAAAPLADPIAEEAPIRPRPTKAAPRRRTSPQSADGAARGSRETAGSRIGEELLRRTSVTAEALLRAVSCQAEGDDRRIGELLVDAGALTEAELTAVVAERAGLEPTELRDLRPEADAVALLSATMARSCAAVPLRVVDDAVEVVVADPSDEVKAALERAMGRPVRLAIAPPGQVRTLLDGTYRVIADVERLATRFDAEGEPRVAARGATADSALLADDAPVVQMVNLILTQALRDRASDVHLEPQEGRLRVRFRIDGTLHDTLQLPSGIASAVASRLKVMARLDIVERRRPQDGQLSLTIDGRTIDMRLSFVATIWGETCVIRLLDTNRSARRLDQLGMPAGTHAAFSKLVHAPFGMVLCAGPTGSGKTTTLYAALGELNQASRNITTIEDPVEYVFDGINQIQVAEQSGVSFATGLRSILRQDPDVILVGEVRDVETARIAVQSALTGHLVLSTLHGTDAVGALHRLLDMGIESFLVASAISAVVGQRLVRRTCESCASPYQPNEEELVFFEECGGKRKRTFVRGVGCQLCAGTGYRDRVGVYELLRVTPEIKQLLIGWATQEELRRVAEAQGMRTLRHEAVALVERGITTIDEVVRSIYSL
jgi:type IV pilus assembly protein PilB